MADCAHGTCGPWTAKMANECSAVQQQNKKTSFYQLLIPNKNAETLPQQLSLPAIRISTQHISSETTVDLISGANRGIGLAAATRLAKEHG
jgi:hypothetical protein